MTGTENTKSGDDRDKEYGSKLPETLRQDLSMAFSKMLSDDPAVKVVGTRSFMSYLKMAVTLNGDTRYNTLIAVHTYNAINALNALAEDNPIAAMELCFKVIEDLGFLAYSGYGTADKSSSTAGLMTAGPKPAAKPAVGGERR